jgi:sugar phosphate isomerase/epimerase
MIAISTSWISTAVDNGGKLLKALEAQDIFEIELEYRITEKMFREMRDELKRFQPKVTSVHNFFPHPDDLPRTEAGGDLYPLSHPDKDARQLAIRATARTIEHANDLQAKAVVLHGGGVDMDPEQKKLREFLAAGEIKTEKAEAFIASKMAEREKRKSVFLDSLLFSLDRLVKVAERENMLLGMENRFHYHELPGPKELETIFSEFKGGPIGYWHDTGHAHANEILTLMPVDSLLEAFSDKLIGVHLHDAKGLRDHRVPGTGEIDFSRLKAHLKAETILVMELKPGTSGPGVSEGLRHLKSIL